MGTPNYISPEQLKGHKVDGRSDIFSLGIVVYEMLIGERPFKGSSLTSLIYNIVNTEAELPSKSNPRVPPLFDHVCQRALKKEPAERYQKAGDMASALSDFVQSFANRDLISGDFTKLGVEVMLSGIAMSLAEEALVAGTLELQKSRISD